MPKKITHVCDGPGCLKETEAPHDITWVLTGGFLTGSTTDSEEIYCCSVACMLKAVHVALGVPKELPVQWPRYCTGCQRWSNQLPHRKYCGDGSDKNNDHVWLEPPPRT